MSADAIRALKAETGRTMAQLTTAEDGEPDEANAIQLQAWLEYRRQGRVVAWADCGHVWVEMVDEPPDPSNGEPSMSSPPSAASGE